MIKLFLATIDIFRDVNLYNDIYYSLNKIRRDKVDKYSKLVDRQRSLLAGYLLKYSVGQCGIDYDTCEFIIDESGYEHIVNEPECYFSLSHSGDVCVCAVSNRPIGVDVERKSRFLQSRNDLLSKRIMNQEEFDLYNSLVNDDRILFSCKTWTRKEAYSKMCQKGLAMDLKTINTIDDGGFKTFEYNDDYLISIVVHDRIINYDNLELLDVSTDLEAINA